MSKHGLALLFLTLTAAHAPASPAPSPTPADESSPAVLALQNTQANLAAAKHLGVPLAVIEACRAQGFPLWMAMIQAAIAKESGHGIQDVIAGRVEGYSWGEMAKAWGFSLDKVLAAVEEASRLMVEEGAPFPPTTKAESARSVGTGRRAKPLAGSR